MTSTISQGDIAASSSTPAAPSTITSRLVAALFPFKKTATPLEPEVSYPYEIWGKNVQLDIPPDNYPSTEEIEEMESEMPGCEHGWFESSFEGKQLHYRKFLPASVQKPKAIIVHHHGIQDHSGDAMISREGRKLGLAAMIEYYVTKRGYALYAMDQLGHGYSEGRRMFISDYQLAVNDLITFTQLAASQHDDTIPLFLTGHSFGGCLVLHAAHSFQTGASKPPSAFRGIILLAPAIVGDVPPFPVTFVLRYFLAPRYPTWIPFFMPNPVSPHRIWVDSEVLARHTNDRAKEIGLSALGKPFCLGTAVQLLTAVEDVRSRIIPNFSAPFCAVHGTSDYGVPCEGTKLLDQRAQSKDKKVLLLEGASHDLLSDPLMEETMAFVMSFIEERL